MEGKQKESLKRENVKRDHVVFPDDSPVREEDNVAILYPLPKKTLKKKRKWFPPLLIAGFSAIAIGLILGVITLQLFVNIDQPVSGEINNNQSMVSDPNETKLQTIAPFESLMIQAGVFSDVTNAEKWENEYTNQDFPTVIWERDGEWYLFVGIYFSDREAKNQVIQWQEQGVDVFMKPWSTSEKQVEMTASEQTALITLQQAWEKALTNKDINQLTEALTLLAENEAFKELGNVNTSGNTEQFFLDLLVAFERIES